MGVQMVGYSMICFGVGGSMGSFVFGKLTKYLGRIAVFLAGRHAMKAIFISPPYISYYKTITLGNK